MRRSDHPTSDVDDLLPGLGLAEVLRQRPAGIGSFRHAIRIALAVTASWAIAVAVSRSTFALFAPITTLLVVQTSPWTTLGVSVQRILGTGAGVLAASVYVNLLGLSWWSFLIGVMAALLVARLLPWSAGGQLQIPVAVVFVLALGPGTIEQDVWRVLDVLVGGVVGLIAVFAFPSRPRPDAFESALRTYRDAVVRTLESVGRESGRRADGLAPDALHDFVAPSRRLREHADVARDALVRLAEGSQLNLRAGGIPEELEARALRLRRLSGIGVQVRGVVGAANRAYDRGEDPVALTGPELEGLIDEVVALMHVVLGRADEPVGAGDRDAAEQRDRDLATRLRTLAHDIGARSDADVLLTVGLLGRLDHIRTQLAVFPEWQA